MYYSVETLEHLPFLYSSHNTSKNPQQPEAMLTGGFGMPLTPPELKHGPTHLAFAGASRVLSA